jgi:hypothetical protein
VAGGGRLRWTGIDRANNAAAMSLSAANELLTASHCFSSPRSPARDSHGVEPSNPPMREGPGRRVRATRSPRLQQRKNYGAL